MVTRIHLQPVLSHYSSIFIFTIAPKSGVGTSFILLFNRSPFLFWKCVTCVFIFLKFVPKAHNNTNPSLFWYSILVNESVFSSNLFSLTLKLIFSTIRTNISIIWQHFELSSFTNGNGLNTFNKYAIFNIFFECYKCWPPSNSFRPIS